MNAFKRIATQACVIFGIFLAMFAALEAAARVAKYVKSVFAAAPAGDEIVLKQPWGRQVLADQGRTKAGYDNYVVFREKEFRSSTTNVDEKGRRAVPGNCAASNAKPYLILIFGGSTMFGYGVPDEFTIPAYLARALNRSAPCVALMNYGSGWWQSSQSTIQLLMALRDGIRPNAVVFYDGINDVDVVAFGGAPGGIAPDIELELTNSFDDEVPWRSLAGASVLLRVTARLLGGTRAKDAENAFVNHATGFHSAASNIVQVYVHNVRTVEALAKEYGFDAYFFLQPFPVISGKTNTALENRAFQERARHRNREADFIREAYERWRNDAYLNRHRRFYDISRLFDGMTQELYADTEHLLPEGNRLVAERMAKEIRVDRRALPNP